MNETCTCNALRDWTIAGCNKNIFIEYSTYFCQNWIFCTAYACISYKEGIASIICSYLIRGMWNEIIECVRNREGPQQSFLQCSQPFFCIWIEIRSSPFVLYFDGHTIKPGLAPFVWLGFNFGSKVGPKQIFGLASKVGLVSILASKEMSGLKFENIFFLSNFTFIYIEPP